MSEVVYPANWHPHPRDSVKRRQGKPNSPFIVTASEIQSFRRCEGAWNFTSANRQSLSKRGMPIPALNIGGGAHYALSRHWGGHNWLEAVNEHYAATKARVEKDYLAQVGCGLSQEEITILSQQRWDVQRLLEAYFARYGTEWPTKPYRIVAAEVTFAVPLVPDQNIWFMGTIDRIYVHDREPGIPVIGEIKTYKSAPKPENWRFNFQCYMYAAALAILLGVVPPQYLYDGLRKKTPTEPKILKNGTVSRRWIDTTYDEYIRTVRHVHRGKVPEEYRDILSRLLARDQSPMNAFTTRFRVPILNSGIEHFWDEAQTTARRMLHIHDQLTYNKDWTGCTMCRVKDLCDARFAGEDLSDLIERNYVQDVSPTRKATKIATPKKVKTLEQLVEFARDQPRDPLHEHSVPGVENDD